VNIFAIAALGEGHVAMNPLKIPQKKAGVKSGLFIYLTNH